MKPSSPLPWKISGLGYLCSAKYVLARTHDVPEHVATSISLNMQDATYIAHAANAYPRLMHLARTVAESGDMPLRSMAIHVLTALGELDGSNNSEGSAK